MEQSIIPFEDKTIRKVWHNEEWFFNIGDIISVLTDSKNPSAYWRKLKERLLAEGANEVVTNCHKLKFQANDGKNYLQDGMNTESILRLVMSVPSPKAEPLKLWMAQASKERIEETENPEISIDRLTQLYKAKGYDDIWIGNRLKTIGIRKELTEEWKARGIKEGHEYSILTAEIAKATFGLTPTELNNLVFILPHILYMVYDNQGNNQSLYLFWKPLFQPIAP